MLSQMDVDEGEWITHERKRRAAGRSSGGAAAAWADEFVSSKGGVGPTVDEAMARRANRAAQRVLERLNHVVREGAQGSDDTSRRASVRRMLADSAAVSNDGEPVSDELMQSIEARVATLVRAGLDQKEGFRLMTQLGEAQSFAEAARVWKNAPQSWSLMPLSHLWACLARWAKSERRSGREALGADLDKLLDCTLEQVVAADRELKGGRRGSHVQLARHVSTVLTAAAKLGLRPDTSERDEPTNPKTAEREAALFSVLDDAFVAVIEKASLHHVASVVWANGKAGSIRAKSWTYAERLVTQRGVVRYNDGLRFGKDNKYTNSAMVMVNVSMLLTGFANASRPSDAVCTSVASELPECLRSMRKHELEDDHVSVVNIAWAFAKLGYVDASAFDELCQAALRYVRLFTPQNVTNIVWAFATVRLPHSELFGALALHAAPCAGDYTEQGISMTLWAYATTGLQAPNLFSAFARVARHRIQTYTEQGLVSTIWALGKLAFDAPELFEAALRIAVPKIGTFMVEHMSQLMQGVAFSTFRSPTVPKLAAAICEQVRKLVEVGDEQTVVVAVHSMASAGFAVPGPVASQMAHGLMSKRPDARHLTQMAWALVTSADVGGVGSPLGGLLDLLSVAALRQAPEFKNKDRALFGWTLWKGHCEHGHGFTPQAKDCVLTLAAGHTMNQLTEHDLANYATVFYHCPELRVPAELAAAIQSEGRRQLDTMTPQHFGAFVRYLAVRQERGTAQQPDAELWADIESAWVRRHRSMEGHCTVSLVWAIATAGAAAARLHKLLGTADVIGRVLEDDQPQWLANVAWGCATSEVGLPSIFGPVCEAAAALLRRSAKEFKLPELSSLLWAVAASGFHSRPPAKALLDAAMGYLANRERGDCDGQAVCNMLWALAVADMRDHRSQVRELHSHFLTLYRRGRIVREGLSQAHQYQLWVELELRDDALLFDAPLRQVCRGAMEATHSNVHVSGLQNHVARVLRELGVGYQLELNISGYSVDVALPASQVAIEVDGPHHYMYDFAMGKIDVELANPVARMVSVNGASTLKHRLLRAMGWRSVSIPFFEFQPLRNPFDPTAVTTEMTRYVSAKLPQSEAHGSAPW